MFILRRIIGGESAVGAPRRHHGSFEGKIDKAFQNGRRALEALKAPSPRLGGLVTFAWPLPS